LTFNTGNSHNLQEIVNTINFEGVGANQVAINETIKSTDITLGLNG
jgi:hypothetical protein